MEKGQRKLTLPLWFLQDGICSGDPGVFKEIFSV